MERPDEVLDPDEMDRWDRAVRRYEDAQADQDDRERVTAPAAATEPRRRLGLRLGAFAYRGGAVGDGTARIAAAARSQPAGSSA
jgi:hypothetical protein